MLTQSYLDKDALDMSDRYETAKRSRSNATSSDDDVDGDIDRVDMFKY